MRVLSVLHYNVAKYYHKAYACWELPLKFLGFNSVAVEVFILVGCSTVFQN